MRKFADFVIKYRMAIMAVVTLLTVFFGYQLKDIKVNSDIISYLSPDDPGVQLFNRIGEEYAGTSIAMIGLEANNVFDYESLTVINNLTEKLKQINGVASVMSLTDVLDIRSVEDGLEVARLIDKNNIPKNPEELRKLRDYTLSKDMYNGRIVSANGKVTIIIARIKQSADKQTVAQEIKTIARQEAGKYKLYFSGLPMQMIEINDIIIQDMLYLVPIVALVLVLMLYFSFRTKRGVLLPLLTVLISTVWAMGLMTLMGIQLSIISNIMPVILIAVGSAYGIHMLARYQEDIHTCSDTITCIRDALAEVGVPIILAGVTTLIGFLSFAGSYLTAVTHFGVFTGIGVAFALIISVTFIPALLTFFNQPQLKRTKEGKENNTLAHFLDHLAVLVINNEKLIIGGAIFLIIVSVIGLPRLKREVNMLEYFPEDTDIRIAENMMEKDFGGSTPIQIVVQGDLKNPFVLKEMRRLEEFMETAPYVSKPQSVADLICEMNKVMNHHYTIPDTREGVANLWFFIEGESILKQLVNADGNEGIIQANLGTMDTKKLLKTVNLINDYIASQMDTSLIVVTVNEQNAQQILRYKSQKIANDVLADLAKHKINSEVDNATLTQLIRDIATSQTIKFNSETLREISDELDDFFLNESEIEIDNEEIVKKINDEILNDINAGRLPDENALADLIIRHTSSWIRFPQEDIDDTAHSLFVLLNEYARYQNIMNGVDRIISQAAPYAKDNLKLRDDLRDDLWLLNDTHVALPQSEAAALHLEGERVSMRFIQSGMPIIFAKLDADLMKSQVQSLLIALILVTIILVAQLKSITGGLIGVSPIVLTVLLNFALMAYLEIPLDNATMMIASIAIGIGIDYSIHFTSRFKEEYTRSNHEALPALEKTLLTTGKAILINALSVAMGFSVLIFAKLIPIQRFGWLTATTMLFSSFGAITFLPALILITRAKFIGNFNGISLNKFNQAKK